MNYLGDYPVGSSIYLFFNTYSSDDPSASMTITGLALGDIKIYKNGGTTERSSTSGFVLLDTDGIDFDAITGIHGISIDLSDNTDAGFYAAGNEYAVVLASVTLDGATVNYVAGHFSIERAGAVLSATALAALEDQYDGTGLTGDTYPSTQAQVGNLTSGTAAINTVPRSSPDGFVITTGTAEANTEDSTHALDGTTHDLEDAAGTTDCYYIFDVGGNGVPVSVTWHGYVNSVGDDWGIYAYNWVSTAWEQVGSRAGVNGSTIVTETFDLTNAHVGTAGNIGLVQLRFYSTDGTKIATDRILCSYSVVAQSVGYASGAIWVDSAGTSGAEDYVNGTADNPCPWANALTISASLGIKRFHIANDVTVTLSASLEDAYVYGEHWYLALGGQSINDSVFEGAALVTGNGTAVSHTAFTGCSFGAGTYPPGRYRHCGFGDSDGLFSAASAGEYVFHECYSIVAGSGSPDFTFAGLGSATGVNNRGWFGGAAYTLDTNCTLSHEVGGGGGTIITPADANVEIRGLCRAITLALADTDDGNTIQVIANTGPVVITSAGSADNATINLYGTNASLADASNGTTNDYMVSNTSVNAEADTALTDYDPPTKGELDALIGSPAGADVSSDIAAIKTDTGNIETDTQDIQARVPAVLVSGRIDASVGAMAADVVTASAIAVDAITSSELAASAAQKIRDEILPTQNAAFSNLKFLFVAASDHVTPVTGASGMAVTRSIDGGAFGAGGGSLAEIGNGIYQYDSSAADMNGGVICFRFTATGGTPGTPDDAFVTVVTGGGV